jgi:hypothetical protein
MDLPDKSVDVIVTDPPFFDNVHYSQLADFFYYWLDQLLNLSQPQPHAARRRCKIPIPHVSRPSLPPCSLNVTESSGTTVSPRTAMRDTKAGLLYIRP